MNRPLLCALLGLVGPVLTGAGSLDRLSEEARLGYLREARVWSPIDTASLDLAEGPRGGPSSGGVVDCDFFLPPERPGGQTPKLFCTTSDGQSYKIKYGRDNREVYGEVVGTRLLWALGFGADQIDAVTVRCRGCPEDPWAFMDGINPWSDAEPPAMEGVRVFEPAIIERYYTGRMESEPDQGVSWDELLSVRSADPARAAEQRVHREALALFAALLQHADSKSSQQVLGCAAADIERDADGNETCKAPQVYIGDVGAILGGGWSYMRMSTNKVDFERWIKIPVWHDPDACISNVKGRPNATLGDVRISEPARSFLAEKLQALTRDQLIDVFKVARIQLLDPDKTPGDWADTFLAKTRQITTHRCAG